MRRAAWMAVGLVASLGGCLNQADTKTLDNATAQVFTRMQAQQYAEIYADAAPDLTATVSQAGFVSFMQGVDGAYGACQLPTKQMNFHVNATTSGYFSTQGYTAKCVKGSKELQVTMVLRQGVAKLAGLHIGTPAADGNPD